MGVKELEAALAEQERRDNEDKLARDARHRWEETHPDLRDE